MTSNVVTFDSNVSSSHLYRVNYIIYPNNYSDTLRRFHGVFTNTHSVRMLKILIDIQVYKVTTVKVTLLESTRTLNIRRYNDLLTLDNFTNRLCIKLKIK